MAGEGRRHKMQNTGHRKRGQAEGFCTAEGRTETKRIVPGKDSRAEKESCNMVHIYKDR